MTNDRSLYERLALFRNHGNVRDPARLENRRDGPWYYEMQILGYNYRLTDIQAALGISQLRRLDRFVARRREIVEMYRQELSKLEACSQLSADEDDYSSYHLFPILVDFTKLTITRARMFDLLAENGLRLQVHYIPVHLQPYYRNLGFSAGMFPRAEAYYQKTISLPLYPSLSNREVRKISQIVRSIIERHYA
jgi:perosamine synthetase